MGLIHPLRPGRGRVPCVFLRLKTLCVTERAHQHCNNFALVKQGKSENTERGGNNQ